MVALCSHDSDAEGSHARHARAVLPLPAVRHTKADDETHGRHTTGIRQKGKAQQGDLSGARRVHIAITHAIGIFNYGRQEVLLIRMTVFPCVTAFGELPRMSITRAHQIKRHSHQGPPYAVHTSNL